MIRFRRDSWNKLPPEEYRLNGRREFRRSKMV